MFGFVLEIDFAAGSTWLTIGRLAAIGIAAYVAVLWVALILWTARDVSARTDDTWTRTISVLVVAIFFLPGLVVYLALRPQETAIDAYNRQMEAAAFMHEIERSPACPTCYRAVQPEFVVCPNCRTALKSECDSCGSYVSLSWVACPYCSAERGSVVAAPAPTMRGAAPTVSAPPTAAPSGMRAGASHASARRNGRAAAHPRA